MKENERDVKQSLTMVLAGDVGGTKTLLGLFDRGPARPHPLAIRAFNTAGYTALEDMIDEFRTDASIRTASIGAACFGVAGPVFGDCAELTNGGMKIDGRQVRERFGYERVRVLNDLEAMAYGVTVLHDSEMHRLQDGRPQRDGNVALIAAGTGLGEALLHFVDGRLIPSPSEGGHADFAARNAREIRLLHSLIASNGRADVEHVVSGSGLVNIHKVTHDAPCRAVMDLEAPDAPAAISAAAMSRACASCVEALEMFVEAYGAEAGNLALRTVSTGGLFVGGGIAPKILPALSDGRFIRHFNDKAPFEKMLAAVPVNVILNSETGLLGAAVVASEIRP